MIQGEGVRRCAGIFDVRRWWPSGWRNTAGDTRSPGCASTASTVIIVIVVVSTGHAGSLDRSSIAVAIIIVNVDTDVRVDGTIDDALDIVNLDIVHIRRVNVASPIIISKYLASKCMTVFYASAKFSA